MSAFHNDKRDKLVGVLMTEAEREAVHQWARQMGYASTGAFIRTAITEKVAKALGGKNGQVG